MSTPPPVQKARLKRLKRLCAKRCGNDVAMAQRLFATTSAQLPAMTPAIQDALLDAMERSLAAMGATEPDPALVDSLMASIIPQNTPSARLT